MIPCPGDMAGVASGNLIALHPDSPLPPPWTCDPAELVGGGGPEQGSLRLVKGSRPVWIHTEAQ